ncbi:caspase-10-like [Branchiostoma floridae x Branchiostoma japonicum]
MNKEQQLQRVTRDKERLKTEYRRVREANKVYSTCVGSMKKKSVHLMKQRDADKMEIERLKKQIASLSIEITCTYAMSRAPRGVCVIINNIHFEDMAERDGAEGDTGRLREVFESLGFTVVTFRDLDHAKMVDVMKDQGKADHSNYDCFVCVIMSHGTMGKVYSSDDVGIDICELMKPVNAKKCPSLKGKPKLFFIQACQGEKTQRKEGFDHGEYDAKPVPFICHEADFFLGLATVPGYVARRDQNGAPYVHHLAKLLKDFGPTHDLSAIMAMVCDKMNDINDDKFGWISSNHSTLRKKVVFNAK